MRPCWRLRAFDGVALARAEYLVGHGAGDLVLGQLRVDGVYSLDLFV